MLLECGNHAKGRRNSAGCCDAKRKLISILVFLHHNFQMKIHKLKTEKDSGVYHHLSVELNNSFAKAETVRQTDRQTASQTHTVTRGGRVHSKELYY